MITLALHIHYTIEHTLYTCTTQSTEFVNKLLKNVMVFLICTKLSHLLLSSANLVAGKKNMSEPKWRSLPNLNAHVFIPFPGLVCRRIYRKLSKLRASESGGLGASHVSVDGCISGIRGGFKLSARSRRCSLAIPSPSPSQSQTVQLDRKNTVQYYFDYM